MLGDWSSLETPLPWRQKRDGVDGSGMTKGQGERSAVVECSVAAGVRRLCGHAFPPLGTSTAVPIPPPRTCREVENRLPVPAAYSARRNESHQSSSSLLINRRRGGGIIVWHLAYPRTRVRWARRSPRGILLRQVRSDSRDFTSPLPRHLVLASASGRGPGLVATPQLLQAPKATVGIRYLGYCPCCVRPFSGPHQAETVHEMGQNGTKMGVGSPV